MKIRSYLFIFIGFITNMALFGAVGWQVVVTRYFTPREPAHFAAIAQKCHNSAQQEAGGTVNIDTPLVISGEEGELVAACTIRLQPGSSLTMHDTTVTSGNLVITSEAPTQVELDNVTMRGDDAGIHISLKGQGSTLVINNSDLSYGLSIGLLVGAGDEDTQSELRVSNSIFSSVSTNSEGIVLVTTGVAYVHNNQFKQSGEETQAFLLAGNCEASNNQGVNTECQIQ